MKGNEDVFLSLAQNSDSPELDQFEDAKEDHDDWKTRFSTLPGQYPTASVPTVPGARPKSSGQLLSGKLDNSFKDTVDRKHARHSSLSERPTGLEIETPSSLRRDLFISRTNLRSPKSEHQMRSRLGQGGEMDGGSGYGRFARHRPSYSELALPVDTRAQSSSARNGLTNIRPASEHIDRLPQAQPGSSPPITSLPGSDSADSQTAASTMWDELDELKSRMKRLEFTGRPSPSGQTTDRPRTATTAPTTISSSPRQLRKSGTTPTEVNLGGPSAANIHPLLHAALTKAKATLKPQLYRPLEATAADAIALATMTGSGGAQSTNYSGASVVNGTNVSDRQIRRKIDGMCRNVTDLCIALCDVQSDEARTPSSPLSARKFQQGTPPSRYSRHQSIAPEDEASSHGAAESRHASRKSISRLDEFRTARGLTPVTSEGSPDSYQTAERSPGTLKDYASRYLAPSRPETRTRTTRMDEEGAVEPPNRAPSRAMTDVGGLRQNPASRRDYLMSGAQRSPSLRETLAARRASIGVRQEDDTSEAQAPSYSGQTPSGRRLLDRPRGPPSEVGSVASSARRRISSLEPYSPSTRISSFQPRTTSLSQRRMAAES